MKKKGALELSVNTIVIVVLGVTILIVGLAFIENIKVKLFGTTDETFKQIEGKIGEKNAQQLLTLVPDSSNLKPGESLKVDVIVADLDDNDYKGVSVSAESVNSPEVKCLFADSQVARSKSYDIPSGKQISLVLLAQSDKGSKLGSKTCNIVVSGTGINQPDKEDSLIIDLVK